MAAQRLGIAPERTMDNVDRYGNTSAASVPLALAEAVDSGRIDDGDVILLSGFGAGMTWASAVLRWGGA
jgi:3-oxoacyl-[acyl-carrier-protein] synthase-3